MPGVSQPEISSPEESHSIPETVLLQHTRETKQSGQGRRLRIKAHPGQCAHQAPSHLGELLGPGKGTEHTANLDMCP